MEIADKRTVICGIRNHGEFVPMNESSYEFRRVSRNDMDYVLHEDQLDHEVTSGSGSSDLIPIGTLNKRALVIRTRIMDRYRQP